MDTVSMAIVGAVAKLGEVVIKDAYEALKTAISRKYGKDSELSQAIKKFEDKPNSSARKDVLIEEVTSSKVDQDPEILVYAQRIMEKFSNQSDSISSVSIKQKAQDNSIQIGQTHGNTTIKR